MDSKKKRDKWLSRISDEDTAHKVWRERAKEAEEAFCRYDEKQATPEFPVYYTTVQLLLGKINGRPPKPDIRKRHPSSPQTGQTTSPSPVQGGSPGAAPQMGQPQLPMAGQPGSQLGGVQQPNGLAGNGQPGPAGMPNPAIPQPGWSEVNDDNIISMCLERCLSFTIDTTGFTNDGTLAVRDYLVAACGQAKVEMETETGMEPVLNPLTGLPIMDEEGLPIQQEVISSQELHLRHFHWSQFRWHPAKDWKRCKWVCFDHYLTKDDIEDQFGVDIKNDTDSGGETPTSGGIKVSATQMNKYESVYVVHEIWDKKTRNQIFVSECYPDILEENEDPLDLDDFFPCPPPMMGNISGREYVPNPDYWQYEFLVKQCNELSRRLKYLTEQVKDIKFYDNSFTELKQANQYSDGTFVAVKQLLDKLRSVDGKANADSIIYELDMRNKVEVLQILSQQLDTLKSRIYEVNGIADVQRGVSNPQDTATAQSIKEAWADIRTGQRVQTVALFYRDVFRLMSELISKKFHVAQIQAMSGIFLSPQQLAIMRSELANAYSIDVESDSTMVVNDTQNITQVTQFLGALEPLMQTMLPGIQSGAIPADLGKEIFNLVIDAYKAGRDLQQSVESLPSSLQQLSQLSQKAQQAEQTAQQAQQQLQQYQQADEARKTAQTQADVANKGAQAQKTQAEAQLLASDLPGKDANAQKTGAEAASAAADAAMKNRENTIQAITTGIQ